MSMTYTQMELEMAVASLPYGVYDVWLFRLTGQIMYHTQNWKELVTYKYYHTVQGDKVTATDSKPGSVEKVVWTPRLARHEMRQSVVGEFKEKILPGGTCFLPYEGDGAWVMIPANCVGLVHRSNELESVISVTYEYSYIAKLAIRTGLVSF